MKENTIEIYKNYGCLAAEKRAIYTFGGEQPTAVSSDKLTVEIPEGWELCENIYGQKMITDPWGQNYDINQVLEGNERPAFCVYDENMKKRRFFLKVVE